MLPIADASGAHRRDDGALPRQYVELGILRPEDRAVLREAVLARWNVLVAGGIDSGNVRLVNSLFLEITKLCSAERLAVLEDTVQAIVLGHLHALLVLEGIGVPASPPVWESYLRSARFSSHWRPHETSGG